MDVRTWLTSLGLERYEQAFRDGDVDTEVLPELTAEDLINLGVASVGHRRKLLAGIAALRNDTAPQLQSSSQPAAASAATLTPTSGSPQAERRQLTVVPIHDFRRKSFGAVGWRQSRAAETVAGPDGFRDL